MKRLDKRILQLSEVILMVLLFATTTAAGADCTLPCVESVDVRPQGQQSPPGSFSIPGILTEGTAGGVTYKVIVTRTGVSVGNSFPVYYTVTSSLPSGVTVTLIDDNPATVQAYSGSDWSTLTMTTTSTVPAGVYSFTVRACNMQDISGGDCQSGTGKLIVGHDHMITPDIIWEDLPPIFGRTPLTPIHLNAHSSIPGNFIYDPTFGTVLDIGNDQILRVYFVPEDMTNYNLAYKEVTVDVLEAPTPTTTQPPGTVLRGSSFNVIGIAVLISCLLVISLLRLRIKKK